MILEQEIYTFAKSRNLAAGITSAEPFLELEQVLAQKNEQLKGFVEQDIQKRIYPALTMENAKSIIVFAMGYGYRKKQTRQNNPLYGEFSIAAVATDYHIILREHFQALQAYLKQKVPEIECQYFVDTGALVDRAVAVRAGLGYIGKNGCVQTKKFGSLAFLGYMLTNLPLKPKNAVTGDCGSCEQCIKNCPTGALSKNGFDMTKCISYLTQTKTALPAEVMQTMGKQIYGCDVCQVVCPKNQTALHSFTEYETSISLEQLLHCSNQWFTENIAKTAAGWRGKKVLQRNALIALGNSGTKQALPLLEKALQDKREVICATAKNAMDNLNKKSEEKSWDFGIQED